jgi:hypothetical protein
MSQQESRFLIGFLDWEGNFEDQKHTLQATEIEESNKECLIARFCQSFCLIIGSAAWLVPTMQLVPNGSEALRKKEKEARKPRFFSTQSPFLNPRSEQNAVRHNFYPNKVNMNPF